jgi:hypothetical protein
MLLPTPLKCKGYISEFTVHGVEPRPTEKNAKYSRIPVRLTHYPATKYIKLERQNLILLWLESSEPHECSPNPKDKTRRDKPINGKHLSIIYLLPNLSIQNTATKVPRAFIPAKGSASIKDELGSLGLPNPAFYNNLGP